MPIETELKLDISAHDIEQLQNNPLLLSNTKRPPRKQFLKTYYFDTPDFCLRGADTALRIREVEGILIQSVKAGGSVKDGLHQRHEWEAEIASLQFDLQLIPDKKTRELVKQNQKSLQILFTTELERITWLLSFANALEVELAIDTGQVKSAQKQSPICEIELELISGEAQQLFEIADKLRETIPLTSSEVSKAERGYRLLTTTVT